MRDRHERTHGHGFGSTGYRRPSRAEMESELAVLREQRKRLLAACRAAQEYIGVERLTPANLHLCVTLGDAIACVEDAMKP